MTIICKIAWKNIDVEVINDIDANSIYYWLNEKHIETGKGHSNLPVITHKYNPKFKKCRFELVVNEPKYQPFSRFTCNDLAEKLVKTLRADKIDAFRRSLEFNVIDAFNVKQQTTTTKIKEVFEKENIQTEYSVSNYRIDIYFHEYKLAIEVDDFGHSDRNIDYEIRRQKEIENK